MTGGDLYCYPGSGVLKNKLGLMDADSLEAVERALVVQRATEGIPKGNFDLVHLCAIHRHLFQDVFEWAGEIRAVEISKGGHQFQFRQFIETGVQDIHRRLKKANFLRGMNASDFADAAGVIMGDVNYVHPFREGNGRTQLFYLAQLATHAGHPLDLTQLTPSNWIAASRAAHGADYKPMAAEIARVLATRSPDS